MTHCLKHCIQTNPGCNNDIGSMLMNDSLSCLLCWYEWCYHWSLLHSIVQLRNVGPCHLLQYGASPVPDINEVWDIFKIFFLVSSTFNCGFHLFFDYFPFLFWLCPKTNIQWRNINTSFPQPEHQGLYEMAFLREALTRARMTIYLQRTNDHGDPTQVTSSLGKNKDKVSRSSGGQGFVVKCGNLAILDIVLCSHNISTFGLRERTPARTRTHNLAQLRYLLPSHSAKCHCSFSKIMVTLQDKMFIF